MEIKNIGKKPFIILPSVSSVSYAWKEVQESRSFEATTVKALVSISGREDRKVENNRRMSGKAHK